MSPERVRRAGHSKADDMWAMGVCLFIMLCGSHPFDPNGSRSAISIADEIERGHYDTENPLWSSLSSSARDLISRLLEREKSKRITSVRGVQSVRMSLLPSCHITFIIHVLPRVTYHSVVSTLSSELTLEHRYMNY